MNLFSISTTIFLHNVITLIGLFLSIIFVMLVLIALFFSK